jgi:ankyrin repeat protein
MMAAASARPNPAVTALLLENGADLHARDDVGRTALDWALMQGETPVVRPFALPPISLARNHVMRKGPFRDLRACRPTGI